VGFKHDPAALIDREFMLPKLNACLSASPWQRAFRPFSFVMSKDRFNLNTKEIHYL
jgi:hypothetical protein